ncbi:zinc ribbon domain-containing protein [Corynebacterium sp. NPDC060344]|uniref:zinc ribbon domain-containing protein n=1 Tax=Corynebacterium sp. NPDC060344 TaxID=3347101 RepID=UPI0036644DBF
MKLDPVTQVTILELSEAQARMDGLEARRQASPERAELTSLLSERAALRTSSARSRLSARDLGVDVDKLESDLDKLRRREDEDRRSLDAADDADVRRDLEHDLASTRRRREELEHHIADVRDIRDAHQMNTGADAGELEERIRAAEQRVADSDLDMQAQVDGLERRMEELRGAVEPKLLARYDEITAETGIGVARLDGRTCRSCYMELDASTMRDFERLAPEEVVNCPDCRAWLVRPVTLKAAGKGDGR